MRFALERPQKQGDTDVFTSLERVRQRQKAATRHEVAGVSIGARQMEVHLPAQNGQQHHDEQPHHEQGGQVGRTVIEGV